MAWFALGRLAGVIVFLTCVVATLIGIVSRHVAWAVVAGALAAVGLGAAIVADNRMQRTLRSRIQAMQKPVAFDGVAFEAGLKAWKAGLAVLIVVGSLFPLYATSLSGSLKGMAIGAAGLAISGGALAAYGVLALLRWRSGFLLRFDSDGVRSPVADIPWCDVQGIDLDVREYKGQVQSTLVIAVSPHWLTSAPSSAWRRLLLWTMVKVERKRQLVLLPLAYVDAPPQQVLSAACALAERHGAPRVQGWSYPQPLARARQHAQLQKQLRESVAGNDRLLAQARAELRQAGYEGSTP